MKGQQNEINFYWKLLEILVTIFMIKNVILFVWQMLLYMLPCGAVVSNLIFLNYSYICSNKLSLNGMILIDQIYFK
jgi:hypothetical protein